MFQELVHDHTFIALDYLEELKKWSDPAHYDENVHVVQLPYSAPVIPTAISLEQQKEKKKELARRLIEINARKREEKVFLKVFKIKQILKYNLMKYVLGSS